MAYTTIKKPSDYFNTVTWTGTGDATTTVSGVSFQPDFTWIKNRNVADDHALFDAVRGVEKVLFSNASNVESTNTESLTAFNSDGFVTGNHRGTGGDAGNGMVSWNWLGSNTTASNTDGSISSTVSANTTSGFSIVSYTGTGSNATVGHGLGVVPEMILIKEVTGSGRNWRVYHKAIGNGKLLYLNNTDAQLTDATAFNNTSPTFSVFSVGTSGGTNDSGNSYVAYCFASVQGYSKFGSYTGNGSATDGTFIYTGFKPAFVMMKCTDLARSWQMHNNKSDPFNSVTRRLFANLSDAEVSNTELDFLSNGFKVRTTDLNMNGSGNNYIYMCFAEEPLVGDNPCTAR